MRWNAQSNYNSGVLSGVYAASDDNDNDLLSALEHRADLFVLAQQLADVCVCCFSLSIPMWGLKQDKPAKAKQHPLNHHGNGARRLFRLGTARTVNSSNLKRLVYEGKIAAAVESDIFMNVELYDRNGSFMFDEATSAQDNLTQKKVAESLEGL